MHDGEQLGGAHRPAELEPGFRAAMADPGRGSMTTMLLRAMVADGADVSDEAAVQRWIAAFNDRPDDERFALTGGSRAAGLQAGGSRLGEGLADSDELARELPASMPPVRLAPEDVLAEAVRSSPTWRLLCQLVDWAGAERRVTECSGQSMPSKLRSALVCHRATQRTSS